MLATPHYGERWGRYWLDVARYAETCGYERDQVKPDVWKYRDWVIKAFNDDMPYDRFVREQLAGDEIARPHDRDASSRPASSASAPGTTSRTTRTSTSTTGSKTWSARRATAFLGLTVKCARCHDHKFDPIRQTDYYRIAAAFWAGFIEPGARELLGGPDAKTLGDDDVFGWTDRGRDVPPIKLLKKGDPNATRGRSSIRDTSPRSRRSTGHLQRPREREDHHTPIATGATGSSIRGTH